MAFSQFPVNIKKISFRIFKQQPLILVAIGFAAGAAIGESHRVDDERVQDPYCLRCQPQVMGAALTVLRQAAQTLGTEANGVSDNPLIFAEADEALSGGNFHAEPVAFAADMIALAICEIGSMAERRIAMLVDPALSGLPAFLTPKPGLNSGFMIPQVTAAALVSENKQRATPASVDSIPTSANQEDHVSMAAHGARRLLEMTSNAAGVIGIELLAAAQGCDFHAPLTSSAPLESVRALLRAQVAPPRRRPAHASRHDRGHRPRPVGRARRGGRGRAPAGGRGVIKVARLDHLVLTVAGVEATAAFYAAVLGLRVERFGEGRTALHFGEQKISLHAAAHPFDPKAEKPTPGSADLCFLADGPVETILAHLAAQAVPVVEGPVERTGATGRIYSVYLRDPDGNLIEVSVPLG